MPQRSKRSTSAAKRTCGSGLSGSLSPALALADSPSPLSQANVPDNVADKNPHKHKWATEICARANSIDPLSPIAARQASCGVLWIVPNRSQSATDSHDGSGAHDRISSVSPGLSTLDCSDPMVMLSHCSPCLSPRSLSLLLLTALSLVGCNGDDTGSDSGSTGPIPTTTATGTSSGSSTAGTSTGTTDATGTASSSAGSDSDTTQGSSSAGSTSTGGETSTGEATTTTTGTTGTTGIVEPDPIPVHEIPGLESITFWERSGGNAPTAYTFDVLGSELTVALADPLSDQSHDIKGVSTEFYDVYYSDIEGIFDLNGSYLTIAGAFGLALPAGGGLNLAEISLNYSNDKVEYGSFVASFVALGDNAAPDSAPLSIDGDLQTHTTMGNNVLEPDKRLRVTLGFKSSLMPQ